MIQDIVCCCCPYGQSHLVSNDSNYGRGQRFSLLIKKEDIFFCNNIFLSRKRVTQHVISNLLHFHDLSITNKGHCVLKKGIDINLRILTSQKYYSVFIFTEMVILFPPPAIRFERKVFSTKMDTKKNSPLRMIEMKTNDD